MSNEHQHCDTHLWTEISIVQAERYRMLLNLRDTTEHNHLCGLKRRNISIIAFLGGFIRAAGSGFNSRIWYGSSLRSPGNSQKGTQHSNVGGIGQTGTGMTPQGMVSSNSQNSQMPINIARVKSLFVLFGVKGTRRTPELAQMDAYSYASDCEFFGHLKKKYRELRGYLRYWFSVWQFSHCDFVRVC